MRWLGAILLFLWGGLHAFGALALRREMTLTGTSPLLPVPGWPILIAVALAGCLTMAAGVGLLAKRRWALTGALVGLVGLWSISLLLALGQSGWGGVDFRHHMVKFVIAAAMLFLAWRGRPRVARSRTTSA